MMNIQKPYRRKQTATINLAASAEDVFALMCPVREHEWVPGWETNLILSQSGLVEEDCVFITPPAGSETGAFDGSDAIWTTPFYDTEKKRLTMIKVTPDECVTRLDIAVDQKPSGCAATIAYEHTALTDKGRNVVDNHTEANFQEMMGKWRSAIIAHFDPEKSAA